MFTLVGAAFLWLAERWGTRDRRPRGDATSATRPSSGSAQAIALFPGISRSGVTIATGLFLGLERDDGGSVRFLMSVPVIAGAGLFKARTLVGSGLEGPPVRRAASSA